MAKRRIGVYSGTFDPVHAGHIGFALQALKSARLDAVYFVPERRPRGKEGVTHFAHRLSMLETALQPHTNLKALDVPDKQFTPRATLPRLVKLFPDAQLVLLMGSDVARNVHRWPGVSPLLRRCELAIGLRAEDQPPMLAAILEQLPVPPSAVTLITSSASHLSSSTIRQALREGLSTLGLLTSVRRYARAQWLYASVSGK